MALAKAGTGNAGEPGAMTQVVEVGGVDAGLLSARSISDASIRTTVAGQMTTLGGHDIDILTFGHNLSDARSASFAAAVGEISFSFAEAAAGAALEPASEFEPFTQKAWARDPRRTTPQLRPPLSWATGLSPAIYH